MCVQTVARLEEASGWSIVGHEQGCEKMKTILLVEDEPFVREVTGEVLRAAGYRVLMAKNAKEGASLYEAQRGEVELLLTDIILPGETGRVLAGRLQREDPTLKVLFVSGYSEQMVVSETMQEECLGKPFSSEVLLRTVRELLECVVLTNETEGSLCTPAVVSSVKDQGGDLGKRNDASEHAQVGAGSRHSIDGASRFVLTDRESTAAMNGMHSFCTVRAHSRHDDAQDKISEDFCHRVHHHVDRWLVKSIFGLRVKAENRVGVGGSLDFQMNSGGRNVDDARPKAVPMACLAYGHRTQRVESLGEGSGKAQGHVLHDHNGNRKIARKERQDFLQRFGSASRDSHGDDCRSRNGTARGSIREAGLRRFSSHGEGGVRRAGLCGSANLSDQILANVDDIKRSRRQLFRNVVVRARIETLHPVFHAGSLGQDEDGDTGFLRP